MILQSNAGLAVDSRLGHVTEEAADVCLTQERM